MVADGAVCAGGAVETLSLRGPQGSRANPHSQNLIPIAMLMSPGRPHSIIPDALIRAALPAVQTARGLRRGRAMLEQALLFDVKTIHANSPHYHSAHARDEQRGAVRHRERRVAPAYTAHAQRLDAQIYGAGTHHIENRLRSFGDTRGLVYGAYGEASDDVHALIAIAASKLAEQQWRVAGARSASEMRSFPTSRCYRRVGLRVVQAFARHRLDRLPFVGCPRSVVLARRQHLDAAQQPARHADMTAFFAHQAGPSSAPASPAA